MPKIKHLVTKISLALLASLAYFFIATPVAANAQAVECIDEQNCTDIAECSIIPPTVLSAAQSGANVLISYDNNSCEGDYAQRFFLGTPDIELGCVAFSNLPLGENSIITPATNQVASFAIQNVTKPIDGTTYCVFGRTIYTSDNQEVSTENGNSEIFTYKDQPGATIVLGATTDELAATGVESIIFQILAICFIAISSFILFRRSRKA